MLFRWVMLYALQEGDMDVQEGYMLKKLMMFIVATNIIASRPPERRPTGTPHARAKMSICLVSSEPSVPSKEDKQENYSMTASDQCFFLYHVFYRILKLDTAAKLSEAGWF